MNRIALAKHFDTVVGDIRTYRESELKPTEYWLAKLEMKLIELRRLSILSAISIDPNSGVAQNGSTVSKTTNADYDHTCEKVFRSLNVYSPNGKDARRAAMMILDLFSNVKADDDPNKICESISFRYCGIVGIDLCSPDAIYIEIVIREALGLFGDQPPSPYEITESIRGASEILRSLNGSTINRFSVVKKRTRAA